MGDAWPLANREPSYSPRPRIWLVISLTDNRSNLILTSLAGEEAAKEVYDRMFSAQAVRDPPMCELLGMTNQ